MLRWFKRYNAKNPSKPDGAKKPYPQSVKPFNFFEHAALQALRRPTILKEDERICLVTPSFRGDARRTRWINIHDRAGPLYSVITGESQQVSPTTYFSYSYAHLIDEHEKHTEPKSLGPDGTICDSQTRGVLRRRSIRVGGVLHIGKEANDLEEVQAGLVRDPSEVQTTYGRNLWDILRPIIAEMPAKRLQEEMGYGRAQAYYLRSGKRCPAKKRLPAVLACAAKFARERLSESGCDEAGEEDIQAVAVYLAALEASGRR